MFRFSKINPRMRVTMKYKEFDLKTSELLSKIRD